MMNRASGRWVGATYMINARKKPYTERGVRRLQCCVAGCSNKAQFQWQCCATGNLWMPICVEHDVELNKMVLVWIGHPDAGRLGQEYEARVKGKGDAIH